MNLETVTLEAVFIRIELSRARRKVMDWGGMKTLRISKAKQMPFKEIKHITWVEFMLNSDYMNSAKSFALFLINLAEDPGYFLVFTNI